MARAITTQNGIKLQIESKSLQSGGQGGIHRIMTPGYHDYIAKIYFDSKNAKDLMNKLLFMIGYSPCKTAQQIIRQSLAWPESTLYQNNQFIGFLMPMVKDAIELTELTIPKPPHYRNGLKWKKFDISNPESFITRLTICYNISRAVELLHQSKMYTLVDLKPDNIMVNNQGIITMLDLDSIQVSDKNGILKFNADVCTEEYSPPEFYNRGLIPKHTKIEQSWDAFSFAVLCYRILFAIHPYQASHDLFSTISELIQNGFFVHSSKRNCLKVIPQIHDGFTKIPYSLQKLFFRTFEDGHYNPVNRPLLSDWVKAFSDILFSQTVTHHIGNYSGNYRHFSQSKPKVRLQANIQVNKSYNENDVELKWFTINAVRCELNGRNIGLKGFVIVPLLDQNYIFSITGQDGSTISKRISVKVPAPKIKSFSISKVTLGHGLLQWNVSNAIKVLLNGTVVPKQGKHNINLYLPYYTIIAENKVGLTVNKIIKNPIMESNRHIKIKHPTVNINQTSSVINSNHRILFSGKFQNKKFSIHSKF